MHELRVEDVAKEVGISPALVYYYFDTRADLLSRAFEHADARSMTNTLAKLDLDAPAVEQLQQILLLELDDAPAVRDNWVIWSEMTAGAYFDDDLKDAVRKWSAHWIRMIADLINRAQEDGALSRDLDVDATAQRLTGMIDSLGGRVLVGFIDRARAVEVMRGAIRNELGVGA